MSDNTFYFWMADTELPYLTEQFQHTPELIKSVQPDSDGTVKVGIEVSHGLTLYKLFMAGAAYGASPFLKHFEKNVV